VALIDSSTACLGRRVVVLDARLDGPGVLGCEVDRNTNLARVHAELQAENARLRGQLETVMTALTPIEVGVRLIREKFERRVQGGEQS
jgi:hypothetical protein